MTSRERFRETMRYGRPDHVPYLEEGIRDEVLELWRKQGLPADADLAEMFHMDRREQMPADIQLRPEMKKWPTSRRGLKALRRRLNPDDPDRYPKDWKARVKAWARRDHILQLQVHRGFFLSMGVRGWGRFAETIYQLKDSPALVREILEIHGQFAARVAERVLSEVEIDFASFSEPIGGSGGPLISPEDYEGFVLASYQPALEVLRRHKVETILLMTYTDVRALIPAVLRAGFNCLWASEVTPVPMDYLALRREFGRALRLIGGIDLDALLRDKAAMREEVEAKAPPLLAAGGCIPLADGRVRGNMPFENYACYRRLLEEVIQRGC